MTKLLSVFVPFQFDLGGPVEFDQKLLDRLEDTYGRCEVSPVATRSFNISYLSRHAPIIRIPLEELPPLELVETDWTVARRLVIYPWLGTVSLSYDFRPRRRQPEPGQLLRFYDELIDLINSDYLPYLDRHNEMTLALRIKTGYEPGRPRGKLRFEEAINPLRTLIRPSIVDPRPTTYHFMNFRTMYLWPLDAAHEVEPAFLHALLNLRSAPTPAKTADMHNVGTEPHVTDVGTVWSNGWVSAAFVAHANALEGDTTPTAVFQGTLSLCQAQWFLCHIWISIYLDVIAERERRRWSRGTILQVTSQLHLLERDLSDVANPDVMLRDPFLIQLSQFFASRMKVRQHLDDARNRLDLLAAYLKGQVEVEASHAAAKLEMLFAVSAAAAVGALIRPLPLLDVGSVAIAVVVLSLGLIVVFTPLRRLTESATRGWSKRRRSPAATAGATRGIRPPLRWHHRRRHA